MYRPGAVSPAAGLYVRSNARSAGRARSASRSPSPVVFKSSVFTSKPKSASGSAEVGLELPSEMQFQQQKQLHQQVMAQQYGYMLDPALAAAYVRADFYAPLIHSPNPYGTYSLQCEPV